MKLKIDTTNEDPKYWEKVLAEHGLEEIEEPEPIPINDEQLTAIADEQQEEQEEDDEDSVRLAPVKASTADWANEELMQLFNFGDPFLEGGHSIKKRRKGTHDCPEWALNDKMCQQILLISFPKLKTDPKQREYAGRRAAIIAMYFRRQMTSGQIAEELGMSLKYLEWSIASIKKIAAKIMKK